MSQGAEGKAQIIVDIVAPGLQQKSGGWLAELEKRTEAANKKMVADATKAAKAETKTHQDELKRQQKITDDHLAFKIKMAKKDTDERLKLEKKLMSEVETSKKKQAQNELAAAKRELKELENAEKKYFADKKRMQQKAADDFIGSMQKQGSTGGSALNSAFGGALLGGAIGASIGSIMGSLSSLWGYVDQIGTKLYDMAKDASGFGRKIAGFMGVTGFSAQQASTLAYALGLIGKELTDVQRPMIYFTRLLDQANHGSEKAEASLKRLGITKFDNLQDAFAQATKSVTGTSNEIERMGKLAAGFGARGGVDVGKAMFKMKGDFEAFIVTAEKLGVTLSEKDVKAAKEFGHAYETVSFQVKLATARFALQYAPQITKAIDRISDALTDNKDKTRAWGKGVSSVLEGVIGAFGKMTKFVIENSDTIVRVLMMNPLFAAGYVGAQEFINWGKGGSPLREAPRTLTEKEQQGYYTNNSGKQVYGNPFTDPNSPSYNPNNKAGSASGAKSGGNGPVSFWGQTYGGTKKFVKPGVIYDDQGNPISDEDYDLGKSSGGSGKSKKKDPLDGLFASADMRKYQAALNSLSPALKSEIVSIAAQYGIPAALGLAQIFSESTFKASAQSPYNEGVGPAYGIGQQVVGTANQVARKHRIKGAGSITGAKLKADPTLSLTIWGAYMSDLFAKYGDWNLAVMAYHQGEGTVDKLVAALNKGKSGAGIIGPKGRAYAAKIKNLSGMSGDEQLTAPVSLEDRSAALTKSDREKHLRKIIEIYKMVGIIPTDETLSEIHAFMVEEAQKAGKSIFGMTPEKTAKSFYKDRSVQEPIETTGEVSTNVTGRSMTLMPAEQYIHDLEIRLGLTNEIGGAETKAFQLLIRKMSAEKEIEVNLRAQAQEREESMFNLEQEYKTLLKMDKPAEAMLRRTQQRNDLTRQIVDLEIELMNVGSNSAERYRKAWLEATLEIKDARIRANEDIIRSNVRLDDAKTVHGEQVKANFLRHLEQEKTATEATTDLITGLYDKAAQGIEKLLDKGGIGKIPVIGDYIKARARGQLAQLVRGLVGDMPGAEFLTQPKTGNPVLDENIKQTDYLKQINDKLGGNVPGIPGSNTGGKVMSPVQKILSTLGLGGGQSQGPGGTPNWNPSAGGSSGSTSVGPDGLTNPGLSSLLGSGVPGGDKKGGISGMFDQFKDSFQPIKGSKAAGIISGVGGIAAMAGGLIGNNRLGRTLSYAGTGAQLGAQIGGLFGPVGALVGAIGGAAIGALIGLFRRGDDAAKKIKAAASSEFGIAIKDKSVLNSLKTLGENMFGKGKAGANATAIVRSDEGSNIIRAYAESTGQSNAKLDRLNYADPNWSGNDFRSQFGGFRANGGPVQAGYSYIVGERGPERLTMGGSGHVTPNSGLGGDGQMNAVFMRMLEVMDGLQGEIGRLRAMSPTDVVAMGAPAAAAQIADAVESEYDNYGRRSENFARLTGKQT